MSWDELTPIARVVARIKMRLHATKLDGRKVTLSFSDLFMKELGGGIATCSVQVGRGEQAGCVRVQFSTSGGPFKLKAYERGGAGIEVAAWSGLPDGERDSTVCSFERDGTHAVIISVPDEWSRTRIVPAAETPRAPQIVGGRPVDMCAYLTAKGVKTSKLAGDWYLCDGERVGKLAVLAIVNKKRATADLPPLRMDEVV